MKAKTMTTPNLATDSKLHQDAIARGKDNFTAWQYNVIDEFKDKSIKEIKETLASNASPFSVCFESWAYDINIMAGMRNANAFNTKEIFYLGLKKFDKRCLQGIHNYSDINFLSTVDELIKLKEHYKFVGIDNIEGSVSLRDYKFKPNSLFIFGSESTGLTPTVQKLCDEIVFIPQRGSVRSLNAAVASGIILYEAMDKLITK